MAMGIYIYICIHIRRGPVYATGEPLKTQEYRQQNNMQQPIVLMKKENPFFIGGLGWARGSSVTVAQPHPRQWQQTPPNPKFLHGTPQTGRPKTLGPKCQPLTKQTLDTNAKSSHPKQHPIHGTPQEQTPISQGATLVHGTPQTRRPTTLHPKSQSRHKACNPLHRSNPRRNKPQTRRFQAPTP